MREIGVDVGDEFPKPLTDEVVRAADVVITMGCGDACPIYPGKRYEDWELDDPAGLELDTVRTIRDEIDAPSPRSCWPTLSVRSGVSRRVRDRRQRLRPDGTARAPGGLGVAGGGLRRT